MGKDYIRNNSGLTVVKLSSQKMCDCSKCGNKYLLVFSVKFADEKVRNFKLVSKEIKDLEFSQNPKENI